MVMSIVSGIVSMRYVMQFANVEHMPPVLAMQQVNIVMLAPVSADVHTIYLHVEKQRSVQVATARVSKQVLNCVNNIAYIRLTKEDHILVCYCSFQNSFPFKPFPFNSFSFIPGGGQVKGI